LILLEQEMMGWQLHQLDHMQIICSSLQTDNQSMPVPHHTVLQAGCPSGRPTDSVKALKAQNVPDVNVKYVLLFKKRYRG